MELVKGKAKGEFNNSAEKLTITIPYSDQKTNNQVFLIQIIRCLKKNIAQIYLVDYNKGTRDKKVEIKQPSMDTFNDEIKRWNNFDFSNYCNELA